MGKIKQIFVVATKSDEDINKNIWDLPIKNISGFFINYNDAVNFINKIENINIQNKQYNINHEDNFIKMDIKGNYDIWCVRNQNEILQDHLIKLEKYKDKTGYENTKNILNMLLDI